MSQSRNIPLADLHLHAGREFFTSHWLAVDAAHLSAFATATYLDPEHADLAASKNNPLGPTLVDGFLLTSLLTMFHFNHSPVRETGIYGFNYGLDRVRYTHPVFLGQRIRCISTIHEVTPRSDGKVLVSTDNTIEIEGQTKPAMVARWLSLFATRADASHVSS